MDSGTRIGHYEIVGLLGAGGMGEVYRARDLELDRDVAIKVLPEHLAHDAGRLARLRREARSLAALNHSGIAAIHGFESQEATRFIVMELVEGPTLAERLEAGRLPVQEALRVAVQVARAVEAAHERGIVHRDLKPGNLKIAPDGQVKVLDFGLAKPLRVEGKGTDSELPTVTMEATRTGAVMGTPPYMSPEQVRAGEVDEQADIWAFGCLLYEMLVGEGPFVAETPSDTLAAVLTREPDWNGLPAATPSQVRDLLRRCLQKDANQRLHDIADARIVLDDTLTAAPPAYTLNGRQVMKWAGLILAALMVGVLVYRLPTRVTPLPRLANPVQVTAAIGLEDYPTWSPQGRTLAYESNQAGDWDIWVSQIGGGGAVNRTADHRGSDRYPSWSPNGDRIAFWSERDGGGYFVMPAVGGTATKLASTPGTNDIYHSPPEWSADGTELAYVNYDLAGSAFQAFLEIVSTVTRETRRFPLPGTQETRIDLSWSSDSTLMAYVDLGQQPAETSQLRVLRLSDGASVMVTDALANVRSPRWAPDGTAIYFVANLVGASDLWRQRVDAQAQPVGDPQQITAGLEVRHVSFSRTGTRVAYSKGRWVSNIWRVPILKDRPARWDDAEQMTFDQAFIEFVEVSPDGQHLLFSSDRAGNQDLWTMPNTGGALVRLTTDPAPEWGPRYSPDGRQIVFYSYRSGDREICLMPAEGGAARQLTSSPGLDAAPEWSPDGRAIAFRSERRGSSDIWVISPDGQEERVLTPDPAADYGATWSPDSRWVAYTSNRGGTLQVWRVLAEGGEPEQVSQRSAWSPRWSRDGKQIFFPSADGATQNIWSVSLPDRTEWPITDLVGRRGTLNTQAPASYDGYLYFTWRDDVGDIWVMDVDQDDPAS